jgi:hypothetical protein
MFVQSLHGQQDWRVEHAGVLERFEGTRGEMGSFPWAIGEDGDAGDSGTTDLIEH